jgi:hypothetical protein
MARPRARTVRAARRTPPPPCPTDRASPPSLAPAPPRSWAFTRDDVRRCAEAHGAIASEDVALLSKLAFRSGLGDRTAVPPRPVEMVMDRERRGNGHDAKPGIEMARDEYGETCFQCVDALFAKTGINPNKVKFVITNSSLFNPTPSLSAAIINRFGLKDDTINYSLGGMGCSGAPARPPRGHDGRGRRQSGTPHGPVLHARAMRLPVCPMRLPVCPRHLPAPMRHHADAARPSAACALPRSRRDRHGPGA